MIIFNAVSFLRVQLNDYLKFQLGEEYAETAFVSNPVNHDGTPAAKTADRILLTLVNVEEEKIGKIQSPQKKTLNGKDVKVAPEINLNLYLLFIANRNNYEESLKFLSHVVTFFQSKSVFDVNNSPGLDTDIRKLILELSTISFEQLNNLWGAVGAKYLPSVLYKVRMLTVQSDKVIESPENIRGVEAAV